MSNKVLPYKCSWCNKKYSRVDKYVDHAKKSHDKELSTTMLIEGLIQPTEIPQPVLIEGLIQPTEVPQPALIEGLLQPTEVPQSAVHANECNICCMHNIDAVNDPCGHMFACYKCSLKLHTCAICRNPITKIIKIFVA